MRKQRGEITLAMFLLISVVAGVLTSQINKQINEKQKVVIQVPPQHQPKQ